ncbi:MAG TPA: hypothetical protein IGS52_07055 [Oscillatoriaceae cyanobacterium M33_DOE_052]|uniref:Uncharacterized protein n=1 Tax=Planktothricoides sp. SpSt-374 TaxID=2282167 RepID=A0A7C3ZJE3_9CYAN|nr:hypothetical protein [Oscillatoriaceae cyanobacterium M33_DOE_052]
MVRIILGAIAIAVLTIIATIALSPAMATSTDMESYLWTPAGVGRHEIVCKRVIIHPEARPLPQSSHQQPVQIRSAIVSENYCAGMPKPAY